MRGTTPTTGGRRALPRTGLTAALAVAALLALAAPALGEIVPGKSIGGVRVNAVEERLDRLGPPDATRRAGEVEVRRYGELRVTVAGRAGALRVLRVATSSPAERTADNVGAETLLADLQSRTGARCGSLSRTGTRTCVLAGSPGNTSFAVVGGSVNVVTIELPAQTRPAGCGSVGFGQPGGPPGFGPEAISAIDTTCALARIVALAARGLPRRYGARGFACRRTGGGVPRYSCARPASRDRYRATVGFRVR